MNDDWKLASPDYGVDKEVDVHIVATVFRSDLDVYVDVLRSRVTNVHIETAELDERDYDEGWYCVEAWGIVDYEYFTDEDAQIAVDELQQVLRSYADIDKIEIV